MTLRWTLGSSLKPSFENSEFLVADQSEAAQQLMIDYLASTDATGELPLYDPATYGRALASGSVPAGHGQAANQR